MAERAPLGSERTWFHDPRSPDRRMAVSRHADEGVAVISLWHAETCTGTFRLPLDDVDRLVNAFGPPAVADVPAGPPLRLLR